MINLLPNDVRESHYYGRKNRTLFFYSTALLMTAVVVAGIMVASIMLTKDEESSLRAQIDENNATIARLEGETKDVAGIATRLEITQKLRASGIEFSELIPQIGSLLPQGAVINALSLTGGTTDPLTLDVSIVNANVAPVLQQNLISSELFEAADVQFINANDSEGPYKFTASVSISFTGSAEAKRKAAAAAAAAAAAQEAEAAAQ